MLRILIIEDEPISSKHIINLLNSYSKNTFYIDAEIDNVIDATNWLLLNEAPDLIFMDINLSDGSCFDVLNKLDVTCPIIFTTAYDEYAIKAFKTNSIDYLLKPITQTSFNQALTKFFKLKKTNLNQTNSYNKISLKDLNSSSTNYKERFLVKLGNKYTPLKTEDIAYFYKDDIVFVKSFSGNSYPINSSLTTIETSICPNAFFRANRKILINIDAIDYLAQYKPGQLTIKVSPKFDEVIVLSQEKSSHLKTLLN